MKYYVQFDALIREKEAQQQIIETNKGLFKAGVRRRAQQRIDEIDRQLQNYPEFEK